MFKWIKNLFKTKMTTEDSAVVSVAALDPIVVASVAAMTTEEKNTKRREATDKLVAKKVAAKKTAPKRAYVKKVK